MSNRKDITEKLLFEKEDVFADILNVLLFDGEEIIQPQSLAPTGQRSQLKIANAIHEQERDVAKLWVEGNIRFALFGLENQTKKEKDMVMRPFPMMERLTRNRSFTSAMKNFRNGSHIQLSPLSSTLE